MDLKELQENWNEFGKIDPLSSIFRLTEKGKKWQPEEFFQLGRDEVEVLMKDIASLGFNLSRIKALDFGCGVGRITQALAPYFTQVYGIDIAPSMLELAKQYNRYPGKCTYLLNETDDLKLFEDNSLNFIYSNITLQHMEPRYSRNYLGEFMRVLAPQGLLIFQQPSERRIRSEDEKLLKKFKRRIRSVIPRPLLDSYYRIKGIDLEEESEGEPKMEMYAIPENEVVQLLEGHGGRILQISENQSSGPHWISLRYCVTKNR